METFLDHNDDYYFRWFDVGLDLVFYGFYVIFCSWLVNFDYNLLHDYLMELFIIIFTRDNFWLHRYDCFDMFEFPVNHDSSENTGESLDTADDVSLTGSQKTFDLHMGEKLTMVAVSFLSG